MVQSLLEGAAENIAKRAAQLAEQGNVAAIRIFYVAWRRRARLLSRLLCACSGGRRDSLFLNPFKKVDEGSL
jgi:hypothetical protein